MPTRSPRAVATRPSARGSSPSAASRTVVPCTCRGRAIGSGTPTPATTRSQLRPADSRASRNPWRRPGTSHPSCVSTARLARGAGVRYAPRRVAGVHAPRPRRGGCDPRAPRVARAARLAAADRGSRRDALEVDVGVAEELAERVALVLALVEDALDARVDEHLQAVNARRMGDVDVGVPDARAVLRRLRDRVDLGVDRAEAVLLRPAARRPRRVDEAADVGAVREPGGRAVVPRRQDVLVPDDHRPDLGAETRRPLGHLARDGEEVLMPARTLAHPALTAGS